MDSSTGESCDRVAEAGSFAHTFQRLTGHTPFRWQERLFACFIADSLPSALDLPTGLGKTSVIAIWLLARAANRRLPRRLIYVVDRRVVVDQATAEAEALQAALAKRPELACVRATLGLTDERPLALSTLRGQMADNRKWLTDPGRSAIVVGTVDMIGSRLLFEGYGVSRGMRPFQAGLLGTDTLVVLDEAHLCPPFEALLRSISGDDSLKPRGEARRAVVPGFCLLALSATGRTAEREAFRLQREDVDPVTQLMVYQRLAAGKRLAVQELAADADLAAELAARAWALGEGGHRVLVFCDAYRTAQEVQAALCKRVAEGADCPLDVLVGKRRVRERDRLVASLTEHGFIYPATGERPTRETPAFLVATSAGEVGIDIDADHMVCDLVSYERMVQRLGRVNRRGGEGRVALIDVFCPQAQEPKAGSKNDEKQRKAEDRAARLAATKSLLEALPADDGGRRDASPRALAELNQRVGDRCIEAASTPAPLRPALDRAVVDAWSLTSLAEYPGRPEPEPWLRGWAEDEEPQCQAIWRRFLPWRRGDRQPMQAEVDAFFAAARPHALEILEAPVSLVADMLIARAKAPARVRSADDGSMPNHAAGEAPDATLCETHEGILVLTPARELKRLAEPQRGAGARAGTGAWTVETLAALPAKGKSPDREALYRLLAGATVVVSASLGGLDENGLLAPERGDVPETADAAGLEGDEWATGFRVLARDAVAPIDPSSPWKEAFSLPLTNDDVDEPRRLVVLVSRTPGGEREGDPAVSRKTQSLGEHGAWAKCEAGRLADALGLPPAYKAMLQAAACAHDLGKARDLWQNAMRAPRDGGRPYAKTTGAGDPARLKIGAHTYRHEFGSVRDVEAKPALLADVPEELHDLALHLIAAHHGYARPLIAPVDPASTPAESDARAAAAALRFARLQRDWGPWGLAWWEALLRAADWAASARNDSASEAAKEVAGAAGGKSAAGPLSPATESA